MSKYKNKYAFYKGKRFDSKKEANRFLELSLLEQAKQISNLISLCFIKVSRVLSQSFDKHS